MPSGDRAGQPERIAHRQDDVTYLQDAGVGKDGRAEVTSPADPDDRQVVGRVGSDQAGGQLLAVDQLDREGGGRPDDVIVGDDITLGVINDARAQPRAGRDLHHLGPHLGHHRDEVVLQFGSPAAFAEVGPGRSAARGRLSRRWRARCGRRRAQAGRTAPRQGRLPPVRQSWPPRATSHVGQGSSSTWLPVLRSIDLSIHSAAATGEPTDLARGAARVDCPRGIVRPGAPISRPGLCRMCCCHIGPARPDRK